MKLADFTIFGPSRKSLMKTRLVLVIFSILIIAAVITYSLIPSPLVAAGNIPLQTSNDAAYRSMAHQPNWERFSDGAFVVTKRLLKTVELSFRQNNLSIP